MTALEVPRGLLRGAIGSVLPHAGTETEHTPQLGRLRFHVLDDAVLTWATDHRSSAIARTVVDEHLDDGADGFDLPAGEAKKVLQVFTPPPASSSARGMWMDAPLRVEVGEATVTFTETGGFLDGQSLTVRRVIPIGDDRYPDVPRLVHAQLAEARASIAHSPAMLDATVLARFAAAAKAYDADLPFMRLLTPDSTDVALVQIGHVFLGALDRRVDPDRDHDRIRAVSARWEDTLAPLRRPEPVVIDQALTDELVDQAKKALAAEADRNGVKLTVVRVGDPNPKETR